MNLFKVCTPSRSALIFYFQARCNKVVVPFVMVTKALDSGKKGYTLHACVTSACEVSKVKFALISSAVPCIFIKSRYDSGVVAIKTSKSDFELSKRGSLGYDFLYFIEKAASQGRNSRRQAISLFYRPGSTDA
jgi:hypothetical protein